MRNDHVSKNDSVDLLLDVDAQAEVAGPDPLTQMMSTKLRGPNWP